jgi:Spy/CpxP family protein refolding chaperone
VPPPRRKRRWLIPLLLVAVFLCGIVCGAGITAVAIARGVRYAVRHPEVHTDRQTKYLARRLNLNAEQRDQVHKILTEQSHEIRPFIVARLEETEAEIEKILTPEQQTRFRAMVRRWLPDLPEPPAPHAPR